MNLRRPPGQEPSQAQQAPRGHLAANESEPLLPGWRPAPVPARPVLLVIVDTEEEFDWTQPFSRENTSVSSVPSQRHMHDIFARHGIVPNYMVDFPVASTPSSRDFLRRLQRQGACEIGAHLHPWVNPPFRESVTQRNSFPGNLPASLELRKLETLTRCISDGFDLRPRAYKAGRYGIGSNTSAILEQLGYEVDLSVAPHMDYSPGAGPDFRDCPDRPGFTGKSGQLLEIPLTIGFAGGLAASGRPLYRWLDTPAGRRLHLPGVAARSHLLERIPLTPEGVDLPALKRLTRALLRRGQRVFSFCYHSPSLAVGHTPYVRSVGQLRDFLHVCDGYFRFFSDELNGRFSTVSRLREELLAQERSAQSAMQT